MRKTLDLFSEGRSHAGGHYIDPRQFPATRYQGSKRKLVGPMAEVFSKLQFHTALDLFSGTGSVTLLLRQLGKVVDANDYLDFNRAVAELFITATRSQLAPLQPKAELNDLLGHRDLNCGSLVEDHYEGIFFKTHENRQIDQFCHNVRSVDTFRRLVYTYAVGQALMKKRPYNLFHRANLDMRLKEVKRSFGNAVTWETSIADHATKAVLELIRFPFNDNQAPGRAFAEHASFPSQLPNDYDLVYVDPPYLNGKGVETNYSNFYGFLNGLWNYELFAQGDSLYPHKPLLLEDSGWRTEQSALEQIESYAKKWTESIIFMSYRSDGVPSGSKLREALSVRNRTATIHSLGDFKYALSRTNTNEELYILSHP